MRGKCLFLVIMIIYLDITNIEMTIAASIFDNVDTFLCKNVLRIHSRHSSFYDIQTNIFDELATICWV